MGKRPRTPHFIHGIGTGDVQLAAAADADAKNSLRHGGAGDTALGAAAAAAGNKEEGKGTDNIIHNSLTDPHQQQQRNSYIRTRNERLMRLEEPLLASEHWKDAVFQNSNDNKDNNNNNVVDAMHHSHQNVVVPGQPWQVSAFAILGMIVLVSAIFLHMISDHSGDGESSHHNSRKAPYSYRRRQRHRYKTRKKKTDEWSDDEEPYGVGVVQNALGISERDDAYFQQQQQQQYHGGDVIPASEHHHQQHEGAQFYPYYHQPSVVNPRYAQTQDHRLRRTAGKGEPVSPTRPHSGSTGSHHLHHHHHTSSSTYYHQPSAVPAYKSPSAKNIHRRAISPGNSFNSNHGGGGAAPSLPSGGNAAGVALAASYSSGGSTTGLSSPSIKRNVAPLSGRLRLVPTPPQGKDIFPAVVMTTQQQQQHQQQHQSLQSQQQPPQPQTPLGGGAGFGRLPTAPEEEQLADEELLLSSGAVQQIHSNVSSFASMELDNANLSHNNNNNNNNMSTPTHSAQQQHIPQRSRHNSHTSHNSAMSNSHPPGSGDSSLHMGDFLSVSNRSQHNNNASYHGSMRQNHSHHHNSLVLSPGNYEMETPVIGNARRRTVKAAELDPLQLPGAFDQADGGGSGAGLLKARTPMPFIPALDTSLHRSLHVQQQQQQHRFQNFGSSSHHHPPSIPSQDPFDQYQANHTILDEHGLPTPPPRSVGIDDLRLFQMETGSSNIHWGVKEQSGAAAEATNRDVDISESHNQDSFATDDEDDLMFRHDGSSSSDISIPSGDPRKAIVHKREKLTDDTNAAGSLQSSINFEDLKLQEVIGGGGFGQVWRATWRGTPVAVKLLTGSAQNTHIAKAILEEFKAEINLLKGMRHPNICLYMGACVHPPNRAIVTELAANGSVWDALRLPLQAPYVPADGTPNGCWPLGLYTPNEHGLPPSGGVSTPPRISAPIPPKGTWPWALVKRVACGAARGMAYLHNGNPPVLHRDLKSANLLLDESYTSKVCDFGLSRLKAQERSMTGNCGTVQWMAPEVLANMSYNEKADIYSFGIILWELLSRECPYDGMTAIQCALAVLNRDKRPEIPKWCPPPFHALIKSCVKKEPSQRPSFEQIILALDAMDA